MKYITKTVWVLSLISLFTDTASEMLYPIMPIYLKSIGFSVVLIGVLEGFAEAIAGFSKGYFGKMSDVTGRRTKFVQIGYSLSAISKPLMAIFIYPVWIFFARTIDRLGKGIRTGARDAILSDETTNENKGKVFGFHRAMDTLGAVIGPTLALIYLHYHPENYKQLFYIAFIPGMLAILASFLLKEKKKESVTTSNKKSFFSFLNYWKESPVEYRRLATGLLIFTVVNSSDVFLLLKAKESGMSDTLVISVYIFYNLIYAIFSFPLGAMADKIGLKRVFIGGLIVFAIVYFGMANTKDIGMFYFLFFLYGIYAAATEGISKAWISNIALKKDTATAIGTFTALQSICTMIASSLTGFIWYRYGAQFAFYTTSFVTICVVIYLLLVVESKKSVG